MQNSKTTYISKEGYAFMGSAFEVYNQNGHGMGEEIYPERICSKGFKPLIFACLTLIKDEESVDGKFKT